MTSPSQASLELQEDAGEVGGHPGKTTKAGRNFGVESGEMPTHSQASHELQRDEAGRNFEEQSGALPSASASSELLRDVCRVGGEPSQSTETF
eukprot:6260226-Karenia_brevis.AAC.1